ncbi:MAG: TonB-dependent receptor domain-containing protein [Marinifilaceae bacterium]
MLRQILLLLAILSSQVLLAQNSVNGKITDRKGNPIPGANVYIANTYDGTSSNAEGEFHFTTTSTGKQTLIISFIGYEDFQLTKEVREMQKLIIKLKESVNSLDAVVVTAGTFSAGDNSKLTAMKSLDVVTTAGAAGNYVAAFQALPGTSTVGESGRLFIRGGNSNESQTFIDGMRVFNPYTSTPNNVPARGRYSPTLFKGMTFSTGGYSAEYGQALSGILLLDTEDNPTQEETNISLMSIGGAIGHTVKGEKDALSLNTSYTNMAPYFKLIPNRLEWKKLPETLSGEAVYRHQFDKGLFKFYTGFENTQFHILQEDIDYPDPVSYQTKNKDLYLNSSYKGSFSDTWLVSAGASYSLNNNREKVFSKTIANKEQNGHLKFKVKHIPTESLKLSMGTEYFFNQSEEIFSTKESVGKQKYNLQNQMAAVFTETNIYFSKNSTLTLGARGEYSDYSREFRLAPRISIAQKLSEHSQLSFAWGQFYQLPQNRYLRYTNQLSEENSRQYILNYQYNNNNRTLRTELYYKQYYNLIKYHSTDEYFLSNFSNNGSGYSKGLDIFWKDGKTINNLEYWISYSYLDTKRNCKDYPTKVQPNFTNKHNLSVVGKYWVGALRSQIGMAYNFASGRPYHDPNQTEFMARKTKNYNSLNLNWAWLISKQTIFYCSATNVLGHKNIFGYDFANQPNATGQFDRQAIKPYAKHFFFAGLFITINKDKRSNMLNTL